MLFNLKLVIREATFPLAFMSSLLNVIHDVGEILSMLELKTLTRISIYGVYESELLNSKHFMLRQRSLL